MKYNQLDIRRNVKPTRVDRGISAGRGKTAGRGTKGQGSRKSGGVRPGFEGGQMPIYMRIPKLRGFTSHRQQPVNVYTGQIEALGQPIIDPHVLAEAGIIKHPFEKIKLIKRGEVSKKIQVKLTSASASAIKSIEDAGGSFEKIDQVRRPSSKTK